MVTLVYIVGAVFAFFIIVLVHECGHFFVARLLNVRVLQFSIGFGKAIYSRTSKSGIQYAIRILPLGGFVQMDDGETKDATIKGSSGELLLERPILVRIAVVLAGPLINFVLAVFLLCGLYIAGVTEIKPVVGNVIPKSIAANALIQKNDQIIQVGRWETHNWQQVLMAFFMNLGTKKTLAVQVKSADTQKLSIKQFLMQNWSYNPNKPALLQSLGIVPKRPNIKPIVAHIVANSPAKNKLQVGDEIVAVDNKSVNDWYALVQIIQAHPNKPLKLTVMRDKKYHDVTVVVAAHKVGGNDYGYLGVAPKVSNIPSDLKAHIQYSFFASFKPALRETWRLVVFHFVAIKQLLIGKISLKSLGGPISIFKSAGDASQAGWQAYIGFLALVSIVIGALNLLPIPGLDGGHLLFYLVEAVIRRPIPAQIQYLVTVIGIGFLIFLMTYATFNDLVRIFT